MDRGRKPAMIERFQNRELDEGERNVPGHIENHGWNVTNIREQDGQPGWAFTIGLFENFGHPEMVIFGLNLQIRHSILNWIGTNVKQGKRFTGGREYDWVLEECNSWSREEHSVVSSAITRLAGESQLGRLRLGVPSGHSRGAGRKLTNGVGWLIPLP
jgi:hypothetical protein